jgi:hypothetical protein
MFSLAMFLLVMYAPENREVFDRERESADELPVPDQLVVKVAP